jgi:glutamate carboxypeptidase
MSLSPIELKLADTIARRGESMLHDLAAHVAIPTGHNFTAGLDEYRGLLRSRLEALGAAIEMRDGRAAPQWLALPGNDQESDRSAHIAPILVARRAANRSRRVLLCGHLDTVHNPHGPFRELAVSPDGRTVVGPGAVDMKGGILVMLTALEALHECGVDLDWTVVLNSDEERGSFESDHVLTELARQCDVGIVVEPALADGSLAIERMGSGQFRIEVRGRAAHVGREFEKGVSAVTNLGEILVALSRMADPRNGMIVNVGPIVGGKATNIVPDYAACWGNMRIGDEAAAQVLDAKLDALATPAPCGAMPSVTVHKAWNRPAKPLTDEVRALAEKARQAAEDLGQSLPFAATGGVCDGNILQAAGLPTIDTLGVRGGNLHRTDEFVEVASLVERAQLMAILLSRLAAGK